MNKYKLIIRCCIRIGRSITDYDRIALGCYHETPIFYADSNYEDVEIIAAAYELFCQGKSEFRHTESAELIQVA